MSMRKNIVFISLLVIVCFLTITSCDFLDSDVNSPETTMIEQPIANVVVLSKSHTYNNDNKIIEYTEYNYDRNGTLLGYITYDSNEDAVEKEEYYPNGTIKHRYLYGTSYDYDGYGNIVSQRSYGRGGADIKYENEYNDDGMIIKATRSGSINHKYQTYTIIYEYNFDGALSHISESGKNGYDKYYEYFESGALLREASFHKDYTTIYEYNEKGDAINYIKYDENGNIEINEKYENEYEYSEGLLISYKKINMGTVVCKKTYKYDNEGNMIEYEYWDTESSVIQHFITKYEYDELSNILR